MEFQALASTDRHVQHLPIGNLFARRRFVDTRRRPRQQILLAIQFPPDGIAIGSRQFAGTRANLFIFRVSPMGGASIDPGSSTRRRSVYLKHSRDQQDKFLSMFDDADILRCYRRSESIVPQQALALSNSKLAIEMSARIAYRLAASVQPESPSGFIDVAFRELLCRGPTPAERSECQGFTRAMAELPELQSLDQTERTSRIRSRLVQAILNHNDFITVR